MPRGTKYLLARWLLLFGASVATSTYAAVSEDYSWLIPALPLAVYAGYQIFRLFSENIRKMTFLFDAVANGDYTFQFTEYNGTLADNLLNMTLNRMKDVLLQEKESVARKEQYYSLILNSVNTGILVINENGNVYQTNDEVMRQFGLPVLTHINQLAQIDESFPQIFRKLQAGEKQRIRFFNERGEVTLSVRCSSVTVKESELRIMTLGEIGNELAEQEVESWIRLIRVMTHEIMNSVTPITSLSETLLEMTGSESGEMREGLEAIYTTGKGLSTFIDSYRELTRIPVPRPSLFDVQPFLRRAVSLLRQEYHDVSVDLSVEPEGLILYADETLIFRVIYNLLRNAAQAIDSIREGHIRIIAESRSGEQLTIRITDNGPGIPLEILPNIFIPFFTTKEQGSGIGLSLSRQIMRLHRGQVTVRSQSGETVFQLVFP